VIINKIKPVAISQWIDWSYMKGKHGTIFDDVMAACRAKHLRDAMSFQKNWNNEIIAQFYATLYVEERRGAQERGSMRSPLTSLLDSLYLDIMMQTVSKFALDPMLTLAG
jgi:hypothetical protein